MSHVRLSTTVHEISGCLSKGNCILLWLDFTLLTSRLIIIADSGILFLAYSQKHLATSRAWISAAELPFQRTFFQLGFLQWVSSPTHHLPYDCTAPLERRVRPETSGGCGILVSFSRVEVCPLRDARYNFDTLVLSVCWWEDLQAIIALET